jgi:DNA repair protein RadD
MQLRPYQQHDLGWVRYHFRTHRAVLLVQPTGAGKGTLASYIVNSVRASGRRVIFLVNRRNLVHDMSQRIDKLGIEHGVIMGDDPRRRPDLNVHVASIDTIQRREQRPQADLLIVDEAHFAVSPTWLKVLGFYQQSRILGLTATPIRTDGRGLGEIFDVMVKGPSVKSLIADGYLVPSVVFRPAGAPSLDGVQKIGGDFNRKQLAEIASKPKQVGDLVTQWMRRASHRKTAAFCVDKNHAWNTAERFRCAGFDFAYVDDETSDSDRERIWYDFDHGQLNGIASVGVISYGWDHPICSCIIGARATASMGLWRQMLGRASRPHPGKKDFYVLDHFDNTGRLDALFEDDVDWTLDGVAKKETGSEGSSVSSITTCRTCFATFRSGPVTCPYCLAPLPRPKQNFAVVNGELVEMAGPREPRSAKEWAAVATMEDRKTEYLKWVQTGRERNYKPTWAMVKYKALFGVWPPKAWTLPA